jgi:hypothetical protein
MLAVHGIHARRLLHLRARASPSASIDHHSLPQACLTIARFTHISPLPANPAACRTRRARRSRAPTPQDSGVRRLSGTRPVQTTISTLRTQPTSSRASPRSAASRSSTSWASRVPTLSSQERRRLQARTSACVSRGRSINHGVVPLSGCVLQHRPVVLDGYESTHAHRHERRSAPQKTKSRHYRMQV